MRWEEIEIDKAIHLLKLGNNYFDIALELGRTKKSVKLKLNKLGYKQSDYTPLDSHYHEIICENCDKKFKSLISENRKFCSQSCSATFNNKRRKDPKKCLNCDKILVTNNKTHCNHKCHKEHQRNLIFNKIKNGDTSLDYRQYKKYLIHIYGEKCMECGWCEVNPYSGTIPIELEHIDGDASNNSLDNLKLLCPNHHALTSTYKGLNIGNGRYKRKLRYQNGESY